MIEIKEKAKCSGCHACSNICPTKCITMETDAEGFWYPKVNANKCIGCKLCEKSCPILNSKISNNTPKAYACYNLDEIIRNESSSGGIFTLLSSLILDKGGVVFGAAFNNEFQVQHIKVREIEELSKIRGSKYVQSNIGNTYNDVKKHLCQGDFVYFSGTPCQIDGLLAFLNEEYDNLICQDIVCHGVPSPKAWKRYLDNFNLDPSAKISFRDKKSGWETYSFTIDQRNKFTQRYTENTYMKAFLGNLSLRPSCYNCNSKSLHRNSDITLADFWGVKEVCPELYDKKGTSLVFINSKKGENFFEEVKNKIIYKEVDINVATKYNPSAFLSVSIPKNRRKFMEEIMMNDFNETVFKYTKSSFIMRVKKRFLKNFKKTKVS